MTQASFVEAKPWYLLPWIHSLCAPEFKDLKRTISLPSKITKILN